MNLISKLYQASSARRSTLSAYGCRAFSATAPATWNSLPPGYPNALNALMIRKNCRLQLSPEEVETRCFIVDALYKFN